MSHRSVDAGLEKSMRFLENCNRLNSPAKNLLRMSRHSQAPQSKLWLNRSGIDDTASLDHSGFFNESLMPKRSAYNADVDLSITMNQWELFNVDQTMTQNMTTALIKGKEPWEAVSDRLFVEFLETIQSRSSEQLFETLKDLIQTCSDTLGLVKSMQKKTGKRTGQAKAEVWWLESERNTWRLLYCLYQSRMMKQSSSEKMEMEDMSLRGSSEKDIAAQLYKEDNDTFECQLIIDWLEKNAHDQQLDGDLPRPEYYTDKTVAWENTLHQLQNKQDNIPYRSSRPTVEHVDPDAPLREGKPLHDLDKEDDDRLMKQVFVEIRCGRMEQAQALCVHCGQPWRAAALEGWRLHRDPNYGRHSAAAVAKLPIEGNPLRDMWKLCAWNMSADRRVAPYARAAHAALCGNVSALLPVCNTWHDQLWARLRALVDVRVETEIRQNVARSCADMPEEYWQNNVKLEEVFTELSSSADPMVREEASVPRHVVQRLLMLDAIPSLMSEMAGWLRDSDTNPQFVRFLAHLVLVLRQLGRSHVDQIGDDVLEAYVKILLTQGNPRLVAFYVSALPPSDQVRLYALYLADVKDTPQRQACLEAAEEVGLDVEAITKTVVENIRHQAVEGSLPDLKSEVTEEDLEKISALYWVVFYPSQREEVLYQSNALIRHFLAVGKVEAAKLALAKVPGDSIEVVIKQNQRWTSDGCDAMSGTQHLAPRLASAVREHLCHRAYMDAQEGFSDWFEHFHHAKPVAPLKPTGGEASFTERVAFDHRRKVYDAELERWKIAMDQQTKLVKQRLYNILLFPNGGWLVDSPAAGGDGGYGGSEDSEEDRGRTQQLANLRQLLVPSIVLLLQSVMHSMAQYAECLQLAEVVVAEQHQLYKVYTKTKLADLLTKLCESSIPLMDLKKDAWGYPM